jgi:hypothetical protein
MNESGKTPEEHQSPNPNDQGSGDQPTFEALKKGGLDRQGETITDIYCQGYHWIVYTTGQGSISFDGDENYYPAAAVEEFYRLRALATTTLKGAYRSDINNISIRALCSALQTGEGSDPHIPFEPLRRFIEAHGPIGEVFGSGKDFMVFVDKSGRVRIEYREISPEQASIIQEFKRLQNLAEASLPETYLNTARQILGDELSMAFRTKTPVDIASLFQSSREFIEKRAGAIVRSRYVLWNVVFAVILLVVLLVVDTFFPYEDVGLRFSRPSIHDILVAAMAGSIGALVSVMQRGQTLEYQRFVTGAHMAFQGLVRIMLGIIFGGLAVIAVKAQIALGIIHGNHYSIFIFCVAAGFSERFIPDLLTRVATTKNPQTGSPAPPVPKVGNVNLTP